MNNRKQIIVSFLFFILIPLSSYSEVIRVGEMDLPQTYEPVTAVKPVEKRLCSLIYEGLVRKSYGEDERGNLTYRYIPALAEEF
ncbi:MAG: hypothetical protein ACE5GM_03695, partial [bacterium]